MALKVAIASSDGKNVDLHFGKAKDFLVYELNSSSFSFLEKRKVPESTAETLSREDLKSGMSDLIKIIKNRGVDTTNIKKALAKSINEDRFMRSRIDYGMNTFSLSDFKPVHIF